MMNEQDKTPTAFKTKISKEELAQLPLEQFSKDIVLVDETQDIESILKEIASFPMLGFDTETRPSFAKGITYQTALLQLANAEKAWVFQLHKTGIPPELANILSSKTIVKVGVAIRDDIKALKQITPFTPNGFVELQNFVRYYGIEDAGLKKLCGIILGFSISKSKRLSNWERETLTPAQLTYAATDAWACALIYKKLINSPKAPEQA